MPGSRERLDAGPCPIGRACGGCALIDRPYDAQLGLKTERVCAAIRARPELEGLADTAVASCVAAPVALAYRNRAKLAVAQVDGETRIGLYRRGSNVVVDLSPCVVTAAPLRRALGAVRRWLGDRRLARPEGPIFYVDLRESVGGRWHLTVVIDGDHVDPSALALGELVEACPELLGVAVNFGDASSSYPMGAVTRVVVGDDTLEIGAPDEAGAEVAFVVPVGGFFQVATSLLPLIHRRMRDHLAGEGPLYDLYCGVGVHGLMIESGRSEPRRAIVGIEESAAAAHAAEINAGRIGVAARYVAGRVERLLAGELEGAQARRFVLNPARAGCRPEVLQAIAAVPGARVAYLACNAETLARDLALMAKAGLRASEVLPLDLMPQTDHVEALALIA